jgi:hypothetical protein
MKKQNLLFVLLAFIFVAACKKEETPEDPIITPAEVSCYLTSMATNAGNVTNYYYDAQNRIYKTATFASGQTDSIITNYTYGDKVVITRTSGTIEIVQTNFLNANGFADSAVMAFGSFGELFLVRKFNSSNQVTEIKLYGEIGGSEYDQEVYMEYTNGNMSKQTAIDNVKSLSTVSTMEYYLDKPNKAKKFEERSNFINSNANLIKKTTTDGGTFTNYTYELDSEGKMTKMMMVNEQNVETWSSYVWKCK